MQDAVQERLAGAPAPVACGEGVAEAALVGAEDALGLPALAVQALGQVEEESTARVVDDGVGAAGSAPRVLRAPRA